MLQIIGLFYAIIMYAKKAKESKMNPVLWGFIGFAVYSLSGLLAHGLLLIVLSFFIDIFKMDLLINLGLSLLFTGLGIWFTVAMYDKLEEMGRKKSLKTYHQTLEKSLAVAGTSYQSEHMQINVYQNKIQRLGSQIQGGASAVIKYQENEQVRNFLYHGETDFVDGTVIKEKYDGISIEVVFSIKDETIKCNIKYSGEQTLELEEYLI